MNYRKFLIAALLVMSFAVQAKDITVTRLTCEMRDGRVTTSDTPRLGWQMSSPENGTRQTAYEIEIRDVWAGKVVWNSGKVKIRSKPVGFLCGCGLGEGQALYLACPCLG